MCKKTSNGKRILSKSMIQWVKYLSKSYIKAGHTKINFSNIDGLMFELFKSAKIQIPYVHRKRIPTKKRTITEHEPLRKSLATSMKASTKQSQFEIRKELKSSPNDNRSNDAFKVDDNNNLDHVESVNYEDMSLFHHPIITSTPIPAASKRKTFKPSVVVGALQNIGNSCYMNAVLYMLRFTPNFTHYIHHLEHNMGILSDEYEADVKICENMCDQQKSTVQFGSNVNRWIDSFEKPNGHGIIREMHEVFSQLTALEKQKSGNSLKPYKLREAVQQVNDIFTPGTQQDAHEFLQTILNAIRDCSDVLLNLATENPHILDNINSEPAKLLNFQYFKENFMGTRVTKTTCTNCSNTTSIPEEIIDVSIPLSEKFHKNFIQHACVTDIKIDDKIHCDDCLRDYPVRSKTLYPSLPRFLIVQLCRFDNNMNKIKTITPIPFTLECFCTVCMSTDDSDSERHIYHLYSIVLHVGETPKSGHYISYVKPSIHEELVCPSKPCCQFNVQLVDANRNGDDWLICDDHKITTISQTSLQEKIQHEGSHKTPYVFLYARSDVH